MQQHHTRQMPLRHIPPHTNNIQIHPAPVLAGQPPASTQQNLKMPNMSTTSAPPNHSRDQTQNRVHNQKHMSGMHHNQTTQMQKIRQQHQHLNPKNNVNHNNNNINNKTHYGSHMNAQQEHHHHQQTLSSMGALHQQGQQHHQHQSHLYSNKPHATMKNHGPQTAALKQILPANTTRQQSQQYGYNYAGGSKPKYNNNNNYATKSGAAAAGAGNAAFSTPKTVLKNPNRLAKTATATSPPNDKAPKNSTELIAEKSAECSSDSMLKNDDDDDSSSSSNENLNARNDSAESSAQKSETSSEGNKENIADSSDKSSVGHSSNKILCNDDSIAKNTKEKTPMCLVNELARFNKITHQYRLTGEKGPAHSKRFTVTLKLGDEEYTAEGYKIKKAQHAAASQALEKTAYKHPIPKTCKNHDDSKPRPYIMPTVELNALAMKLGQQTYYLYDPRQIPTPALGAADLHEHAAMHDGTIPTQHFVSGTRGGGGVGGNIGGLPMPPHGAGGHLMPLPSQQRMLNEAANFGPRRHFDAGFCGGPLPPPPAPPATGAHISNCAPQRPYGPASAHRGGGGGGGMGVVGAGAGGPYAMMNRYQRYPMMPPTIGPPPPPHGMIPHHHHQPHHHMHQFPHHYGMLPPNTPYKITLMVGKQKFIGTGRTLQHAKHDAASRALQVLKTQKHEEVTKDGSGDGLDESMDENDAKSPISQVHEAGIKRNLTVHFKIIREEGPAHMRNFITACIMGSLVTEGEGHGKKISKKRAAEKMLLEIKKLPPVTTPQKTPTKRNPKFKTTTPSKLEQTSNDKKDQSETVAPGGRDALERSSKREKFSSVTKERGIHKKIQQELKEKINEEDCPITRLLQLMQQRKQKEPVFEYIAKSEKHKKREFIVEVTAQGYAARGTGVNKKIAKRNAAENLLHTLLEDENSSSDNDVTEECIELDDDESEDEQITSPVPVVQRNATKQNNEKAKTSKLFDDLAELPAATGQVPGILILRQNKKPAGAKKKDMLATSTTSTPARAPNKASAKRIVELETSETKTVQNFKEESAINEAVSDEEKEEVEKIELKSQLEIDITSTTKSTANKKSAAEIETTPDSDEESEKVSNVPAAKVEKATIAGSGNSSNSSNINNNPNSTVNAPPSLMKQQLLYLANLLGFEVNFSDYPKGNHNEFLTIVALNTDPPQMCHGFGQNTNESQNDAARNALKILSDLGLNNAKSN